MKITNLKQRKKNSFRLIKISDRLKSLILQEQLWRNCSKEDYILKNRDRTTYNYAFVRYALQGGIERERAHPHTLLTTLVSANTTANVLGVLAFEFNGNTYVVEGSDTTGDAYTTSVVVELTGVTGITGLSTTAAANVIDIA